MDNTISSVFSGTPAHERVYEVMFADGETLHVQESDLAFAANLKGGILSTVLTNFKYFKRMDIFIAPHINPIPTFPNLTPPWTITSGTDVILENLHQLTERSGSSYPDSPPKFKDAVYRPPVDLNDITISKKPTGDL